MTRGWATDSEMKLIVLQIDCSMRLIHVISGPGKRGRAEMVGGGDGAGKMFHSPKRLSRRPSRESPGSPPLQLAEVDTISLVIIGNSTGA
jgi:hypothetical protein